MQIQIKICVVLYNVIKFLIEFKNYEIFVCNIRRKKSQCKYINIVMYIKIMKNNKFNPNEKYKNKNGNLLNRVVITSIFPLPNVLSVPLSRIVIQMTKNRNFLMRDYSTGWNSIVKQSCSQQSDWTSNHPVVQRSHSVCKIMTLLCCFIFLCCKKLKHEIPVISNKKNQWYESNHNSNFWKISHIPFEIFCYSYQITIVPLYTKYVKSQCPILWLAPSSRL